MNGKGLALMTIAVVAVGVFALPSTVSLFSGQHTWYDLSDKANNVPCKKCHADIAEEMEQIHGPHTNETGYGRFECEYCHRVFNLTDWGGAPSQNVNKTIYSKYYYTYASGNGTGAEPEPGKEAHAASTVPCLYCHSGEDVGNYHPSTYTSKSCSCHGPDDGGSDYYYHGDRFYTGDSGPGECIKCHSTGPPMYIPPAGGLNLTANSTDTGTLAAHKKFVDNAIGNPNMENANEACIACHTHIAVKINWTHAYSLEFNVTPEFKLQQTHFNVSDWNANGTANVTVYGNATGAGSTSGWP